MKYSEDQISEACELREAGLTLRAIAARTGMSASSAEAWCLKLGADLPLERIRVVPAVRGPETVQRGRHLVRRFTVSEDLRLVEMAISGARRIDICRALDRSPSSISNRLAVLARREARREALG